MKNSQDSFVKFLVSLARLFIHDSIATSFLGFSTKEMRCLVDTGDIFMAIPVEIQVSARLYRLSPDGQIAFVHVYSLDASNSRGSERLGMAAFSSTDFYKFWSMPTQERFHSMGFINKYMLRDYHEQNNM